MTSGKIEPDKLGYSQKVIRKLWNFDLLGWFYGTKFKTWCYQW
jgi:hypothetical protein